MNTHILRSGGIALGQILAHLRDHPDQPCLVHCTGAYYYYSTKLAFASFVSDSRKGQVWHACGRNSISEYLKPLKIVSNILIRPCRL